MRLMKTKWNKTSCSADFPWLPRTTVLHRTDFCLCPNQGTGTIIKSIVHCRILFLDIGCITCPTTNATYPSTYYEYRIHLILSLNVKRVVSKGAMSATDPVFLGAAVKT